MKKICFYALCTLLSVGCKVSHQSSENKNRKKEKTTIDSLAPNPFIRHMYTADPSARVWDDGRLYVYASHDIDPPQGCDLMDRYHVFSSCYWYTYHWDAESRSNTFRLYMYSPVPT